MSAPRWVARQTVEILHDEQIAEHGGASGIRDPGLLESALMRPLNAWSYGETDLHQIAALYAEESSATTLSSMAISVRDFLRPIRFSG